MFDEVFKKLRKKGKKRSKEKKDKPLHNENPYIKHSKGPKYEYKPEKRE